MIIDGHVHIGPSQFLQIDADAPTLIDIADRVGIDLLCVTHVTALFYDMREGNDALGSELTRYGHRLLGYVTIPNHRLGRTACDEIRRCVEIYGMRGVKMYSHPESPITEASSTAILATAAELKLPVLGHFTPSECDVLMARVPEIRIIMAHMAGQPYAFGNWHLAVEVAGRHPNLYLDTGTSQIDSGMLEHAVEVLGPERILPPSCIKASTKVPNCTARPGESCPAAVAPGVHRR
ncbi:MAG: amidohydrolase [Phycisphaerae bacterium]|nr:amidohydrolase [Phycisphaerae bacterium]